MCEVIIGSFILKSVIDSYKDIIVDGIWNFSNDGITMQTIDSSHIFICQMNISKQMFSSYTCNIPLSVGISFNNLSKILKCSSDDDLISLKINGTDNITITFKNKTSNRSSKFELKTVKIDYDNIDIPDKEYDFNLFIGSKEFKSIMTDVGQFGDDCVINGSYGFVSFSVKGDIGNGEISLTDLKTVVNKPVKLTFSVKQLINFTKSISMTKTVCLCMSENSPIMVSYNIEDKGYVKFYLAPKIDNE